MRLKASLRAGSCPHVHMRLQQTVTWTHLHCTSLGCSDPWSHLCLPVSFKHSHSKVAARNPAGGASLCVSAAADRLASWGILGCSAALPFPSLSVRPDMQPVLHGQMQA